ncbi:MAG: hypothetical protein RJA99_540 [Pseudomonadota bacterium]|jgi:hypothetical protein
MTPETEARRRCERLLVLMAEAMEMERALDERTSHADAQPHSLLKPILEDALARLEPMLVPGPGHSLQHWMSELTDLELQLDAAISKRGWRVLAADRPSQGDPA